MKTSFVYDRYYDHEQLSRALLTLAARHPELMTISVNCLSEKKREQLAVTVTNRNTGPALSKPGWYLDGNIHAGEVTSSMAALYLVDLLLTNYGSDETITRLVDTTAVYVIPRVSPDGAEVYLKTPHSLRSADREYHPEHGGVRPGDLDGDGVIRMMRVYSPYGAWKTGEDGKSMQLRAPSDLDGDFFDLYPEGLWEEGGDEDNPQRAAEVWGLDFNRAFPFGWFPDARQPGAGETPLSSVETRALADFFLAHPNIGGAALGHTSGGLLLYPPGTQSESSAPAGDMDKLRRIAEMGREELGYVPLNIFDSFVEDPARFDSGALDDWLYQCRGIPAYTVEYWDLASRAGVPYDWADRSRETPQRGLERWEACVKWAQEHAPEQLLDWTACEHPRFGRVELGGLQVKYTVQNPPPALLEDECARAARFYLRFIRALPRLSLEKTEVSKLQDGLYEIRATVGNRGFLPTRLTDMAASLKLNALVCVRVEGGELLAGKAEEQLGDLEGYADTRLSFYGAIGTAHAACSRKSLRWLLRGRPGDRIRLTARHEKAGTAQAELVLPE